MQLKDIKDLFLKYKEDGLFNRYITNLHIEPILGNFDDQVVVEIIGNSVLNNPIYGLKIGNGGKKILMWSQMHGNESTTTKALFDLLNTFIGNESTTNEILEACSLYIIPILNPDGALAYTRVNANKVDLNRDAQNLTQPESRVLRQVFESFKPDFCYNLHGQRTIFSAGNISRSATVSFLAPAQDEACTITPNRKVAMEVIGIMNKALQEAIPNQVGVYDDAFNLNCVGDTFQSEDVPTILFEAGHFHNDYEREKTRELIYIAYIKSLEYISKVEVSGDNYEPYLSIPENEKCFLDIIIRNTKTEKGIVDIGIQYVEKLSDNIIEFIPEVVKIEKLDNFFGHREIEAQGYEVYNGEGGVLVEGSENVFVMLNNEKILL
ncbi:M14 family zinc carboxypeptidase [Tamlana sp. 2201CG12-4]|uniref:M14 family zinc carboxypeptidase n=1 Tax=Tamlana sp. 2201CG12-4 TaxID=3112582 RepID=UPI002DB58DB0|nr:M14 family zinc carboxypeptidase [Tamlana sp. 2201CG12-4]MEC3908012.1 M14 family zinc carboxypeptidase [Tamlana sp. 2201CG12-4]